MVLQLSTSPFAARASSSKLTGPTVSSNASSVTTTSPSSPISRLSFLSDKAIGRHHDLHKRSKHSCNSRTLSLVENTATIANGATGTELDQTTKSHSSSSSSNSSNAQVSPESVTTAVAVANLWGRTLFRIMGVVSGISTLLIVPTLKSQEFGSSFGRGSQFLTVLGLFLTMVCLSLGAASDLLKMPTELAGLLRIKNAILPVAVPAECAVAILYWYLTLTDVYNIYPDGIRYLPFWLDIQMHGLPFAYVFIEMFCFSETFKVRRVADFCALAAFAVFYMSWSSLCAYMDGYWPYPIFDNLACPWKCLRLMLIASSIGLVFQLLIAEVHIRARAVRKICDS
ncbi:FAR-17a/AIG1-like protein-domain-containing protein [Gamsiella multidivaricata]|uniref:FAR-17a/AIG1-like protein-domain-containing protein n=1 Tax=Gamsiella multidivaricata TaxID=101098 RepID=UPI00221F8992|nr:FAR-17a/AIG1-like protein-domain-containing protein [Gamsiella multidivaricata]KAI7831104.1 FAR-17a/AIG1-like protein-domain-containing protein [Gamsiella multidivaricata]